MKESLEEVGVSVFERRISQFFPYTKNLKKLHRP